MLMLLLPLLDNDDDDSSTNISCLDLVVPFIFWVGLAVYIRGCSRVVALFVECFSRARARTHGSVGFGLYIYVYIYVNRYIYS